MPKKPIKHGIKVFALCDAITGYLYSFQIYLGRSEDEDGSPTAVVQRVLRAADMASQGTGRIVFMDNWYTGMPLFKAIYEEFGMMAVGTVTGTPKVSRTADDFPFHRMSDGAIARVPRGYFRQAYQNVRKNGRVLFTIQATTWKDKKQVFMLSNHMVGVDNVGNFATRFSPCSKKKKEIPSPKIVNEYASFYGGVDRKDRDTADWSTSLKSHRWYLRVFYWMLDSSIHSMYLIAKELGAEDPNDPWHKYSKHGGREEFQLDMAHAIIARAFQLDSAKDASGNLKDLKVKANRPAYTRATDWPVPCDCQHCYFCKTGYTYGVSPKRAAVRMKNPPIREGPYPVEEHPKERVKVTQGECVECLRIYRSQNDEQAQQTLGYIRKHAKLPKPGLGCNLCPNSRGRGVPVCANHWEAYEHQP